MPTLELTLEAWSALEALVRRGVVLSLGLSNCYSLGQLSKLYQRVHVKPRVLQNRFYAKTGYDTDLRAFCVEHEIRYQSFWTLTANPHILKDRSLSAIATRHGVTREQAFFRGLIHAGVTPLTGTCTREHMQQDLDVLAFELEPHEVRTIFGLLGPA
jgi:diketogulonate reductase-like aldo/keto reductase